MKQDFSIALTSVEFKALGSHKNLNIDFVV